MSGKTHSLTNSQIFQLKNTIDDLQKENTEYMNTMSQLVQSTKSVMEANYKLEEGLKLRRKYLNELMEKGKKTPSALQKSQLKNQNASTRLQKYQKQVAHQSKEVTIKKVKNDIGDLLSQLQTIRKETGYYQVQVRTEKEVVTQIKELDHLKRELVSMNQKLFEEASNLSSKIDFFKLKLSSKAESNFNELKQTMLKSNSIREKLDDDDPVTLNYDVYTKVDERLQETIPILNELETFLEMPQTDFTKSITEIQNNLRNNPELLLQMNSGQTNRDITTSKNSTFQKNNTELRQSNSIPKSGATPQLQNKSTEIPLPITTKSTRNFIKNQNNPSETGNDFPESKSSLSKSNQPQSPKRDLIQPITEAISMLSQSPKTPKTDVNDGLLIKDQNSLSSRMPRILADSDTSNESKASSKRKDDSQFSSTYSFNHRKIPPIPKPAIYSSKEIKTEKEEVKQEPVQPNFIELTSPGKHHDEQYFLAQPNANTKSRSYVDPYIHIKEKRTSEVEPIKKKIRLIDNDIYDSIEALREEELNSSKLASENKPKTPKKADRINIPPIPQMKTYNSSNISDDQNDDDDGLQVFDSDGEKFENFVIVDSKGCPLNCNHVFDVDGNKITKPLQFDKDGNIEEKKNLYSESGKRIKTALQVNNNGEFENRNVFDSKGNEIKNVNQIVHSLIQNDDDDDYNENEPETTPMKPPDTKLIKATKDDINKDGKKKKIKKRKHHRIFDDNQNELETILLIDDKGKPINIQVFNSKQNEVTSSIKPNQTLFDINKQKIDAIVEIDELGRPTKRKLFDSHGQRVTNLSHLIPKRPVEFDSSASLDEDEQNGPMDQKVQQIGSALLDQRDLGIEFDAKKESKKSVYNLNQIQMKENQNEEEEVDQTAVVFCDKDGNEIPNPIFVDLKNRPYNEVKAYDTNGHVVTPLTFNSYTNVPITKIFDIHGVSFSHIIQIDSTGKPVNLELYDAQGNMVYFNAPTIRTPSESPEKKQTKLEIFDGHQNLNIASYERQESDSDPMNPEKERFKRSSQTRWSRPILSNMINAQLSRTSLVIKVADARVVLVNLEEEIHELEDKKELLEKMKTERELSLGKGFTFSKSHLYIKPTPPMDPKMFYKDKNTETYQTLESLTRDQEELKENAAFLADNVIYEQQKIVAESYFPELQNIFVQLKSKNGKLYQVMSNLERRLNIVRPHDSADAASKETRLLLQFEESKRERNSTLSEIESQLSDDYIQINDLKNKIEDQQVIISMLKTKIAEQSRSDRPDTMKLCLELDGLRNIDKKNREDTTMLELEMRSIELETDKLSDLIDERSLETQRLSVEDSQRQLDEIKSNFSRLRRKDVKKKIPMTNRYELQTIDEKIKEVRKQIADVKRKENVLINKLDKRIKILDGYGLRIPSHQRVENDNCV